MLSEQPINILLVDDRPENLLALEALLQPLGYQLIKARSGGVPVKAFGVLLQKAPSGLLSLASKPIKTVRVVLPSEARASLQVSWMPVMDMNPRSMFFLHVAVTVRCSVLISSVMSGSSCASNKSQGGSR